MNGTSRKKITKRVSARIFALILAACPVLAGYPQILFADNDLDRKEIEQLKRNQVQIQKELAEIKKILEQRQTVAQALIFQPTEVSLEGITLVGRPDAPLILIEFTDYQCPFCRRYARNTQPLLFKHYVDTGKLRYGIREFPIETLHPDALKLSEAVLCAADQGKYWALHDRFMLNHGKAADPEELSADISVAGLDEPMFTACLDAGLHAERVQFDIKQGIDLGVSGTPSFYFGRNTVGDAGTLLATRALRGAQPYTVFKIELDALLAQQREE